MKKVILLLLSSLFLNSCGSQDKQISQDKLNESATISQSEASIASVSNIEKNENSSQANENIGGVRKINSEEFKTLIFNYETNKEWKFAGTRPCIVDFYADWCGPCKMVAPRLDELSKEYAGKVDFYKVNTDEQRNLSGAFGIRGIPAILYCPANGQPQMTTGASSKEEYKKIIESFLLAK
ncbi:MAG: thioredoxin [Bacteroidales bacterium]|nr:thioredoxin [Bacteroidales bacterium]